MCDNGVASTNTIVVCGVYVREPQGHRLKHVIQCVWVLVVCVCALYDVFFTHMIQCVWVLVCVLCMF